MLPVPTTFMLVENRKTGAIGFVLEDSVNIVHVGSVYKKNKKLKTIEYTTEDSVLNDWKYL